MAVRKSQKRLTNPKQINRKSIRTFTANKARVKSALAELVTNYSILSVQDSFNEKESSILSNRSTLESEPKSSLTSGSPAQMMLTILGNRRTTSRFQNLTAKRRLRYSNVGSESQRNGTSQGVRKRPNGQKSVTKRRLVYSKRSVIGNYNGRNYKFKSTDINYYKITDDHKLGETAALAASFGAESLETTECLDKPASTWPKISHSLSEIPRNGQENVFKCHRCPCDFPGIRLLTAHLTYGHIRRT